MEIQLIDKFGGGEGAESRRAEMVKQAGRWLDGLERRLKGREWIACADFTVADTLLATALREIRKTDLIDSYPRLKAHHARAQVGWFTLGENIAAGASGVGGQLFGRAGDSHSRPSADGGGGQLPGNSPRTPCAGGNYELITRTGSHRRGHPRAGGTQSD